MLRLIIRILCRQSVELCQSINRSDRKTWRRGLAFLAILFVIFISSLAMLSRVGRVAELDHYSPSIPSELYDRKGRLITTFFQDQRILISEKEIPKHVKQAFIAMEDNQFYSHSGISLQGIFRAFLVNLQAGTVRQGGSTITQQLAKVILTDQKRTFTRKIKEAVLAVLIDFFYTKEKILHLYCNQIYFGHGTYGIEAASQFYFSKKAKEMGIAEAAILATLPSSPNRYSPVRSPHLSRVRMQHALLKMVDLGFITAAEAIKASEEGDNFYATLNISPSETAYGRRVDEAPYFSEHVRSILEKEYGEKSLYNDGLKFYASIDIDHQKLAEEALWRGLRAQNAISRNHFFSKQLVISKAYASLITSMQLLFDLPDLSPARTYDQYEMNLQFFEEYIDTVELVNLAFGGEESLDQFLIQARYDNPFANRYLAVQGAFVEIDNITGEVTAMVGGLPFNTQNQLNRVFQVRQPGSSFKPLLYASAIETKKVTAATLFPDSPIVSIDDQGDLWMPENYSSGFRGFITLRDALKYSVNTVSIALAREVGLSNLIPTIARELNVPPAAIPYNLSIALGTYEASPLQMARAFALFPRGGESLDPILIKKVVDRKGKVLKTYTNTEKSTPVISQGTATIMRSLLETATNQGTGNSIRKFGYHGYAGGKTGTTNGYRDAWFVGFNQRYSSAVWVGYDRPSLSLGPGQAGSTVAAPIWASYQSRLAPIIAEEESRLRQGEVKRVEYCKATSKPVEGDCEEKYMELFLSDTGPETGNHHETESNPDEPIVPLPQNSKPLVKTKEFFEGDE